jgi:dienelactone hydrolase
MGQPGTQPYDLVEAVNVPALIMHGTEDEQALLETMQRMEARMRRLGKACAFTYSSGAGHGFAVRTHPGYEAAAATRSVEEARRFLDIHFRRA